MAAFLLLLILSTTQDTVWLKWVAAQIIKTIPDLVVLEKLIKRIVSLNSAPNTRGYKIYLHNKVKSDNSYCGQFINKLLPGASYLND